MGHAFKAHVMLTQTALVTHVILTQDEFTPSLRVAHVAHFSP